MGEHINADGKFQSDKYPTCPAGKVPLSTEDPLYRPVPGYQGNGAGSWNDDSRTIPRPFPEPANGEKGRQQDRELP